MKDFITYQQLSELSGYKVSYLRKLVCEHKLPVYKLFGGKVYFKQSEIEDMILNSRIPSIFESLGHKF